MRDRATCAAIRTQLNGETTRGNRHRVVYTKNNIKKMQKKKKEKTESEMSKTTYNF